MILAIGLSACSARIEGAEKSGGTPVNPIVTEHQVEGPSLDGVWKSDCRYKYSSSRYEAVSMTITGQSVKRTLTKFSDSLCKAVVQADEWNGIFRFMKKYENGVYEVEYQIALGKGATQFTGENLKLVNSTLWISEFYVGENGTPTLQLKQ